MKFDSAAALQKATGRAKSDVANKLVSMFLHEVSRRACAAGGLNVSDLPYRNSVIHTFGHMCLYCDRDLEHDRVAVEHLNGMNRIQVGLHVPGNVALSCRRCNNEKRRDDLNPVLSSNSFGWESFLLHDGTKCAANCKTCQYWAGVYPNAKERIESLQYARERIARFQAPYHRFLEWSQNAQSSIQSKVETLYRACQSFASNEILKLTEQLEFDFSTLNGDVNRD